MRKVMIYILFGHSFPKKTGYIAFNYLGIGLYKGHDMLKFDE
jgi:hypothetical protein